MKRFNVRKSTIACAAFAAVLGIIAGVLADDKKEIPDHTNFKSCQTCHADKQSMWEASGHSKAISRVANNGSASADCYGCHSTEGFSAKQQGNKVDIAQKESFHTISCLACHDPRNSKLPHKLVADPEKLCESCHTQRAVLKGQGAKGIEDSRSFHSGISCVSCHMTEGNHRMEVIRPDSLDLSEKSTDTCTACHKDNNRKARAKQIQDWQSEYKEKMDVLQADINAIGAALKEKPDQLNAAMKSKFSDVRSNLFILTRDGSRGFHNFDYALEIMALASSDLKELKAAIK
jgi:predicted CXXCH cytochrome family protein